MLTCTPRGGRSMSLHDTVNGGAAGTSSCGASDACGLHLRTWRWSRGLCSMLPCGVRAATMLRTCSPAAPEHTATAMLRALTGALHCQLRQCHCQGDKEEAQQRQRTAVVARQAVPASLGR